MSPEEEASVRTLKAAYDRWADKPPVQVSIAHAELFTLVMACQAMLTHPAVTDTMKHQLEHLGRQFQEAVSDTPDIYTMLELGWNRQFDIGPED